MDRAMEQPGARRDNAGLIYVPVDIRPGCRGATCPAFALCQGSCAPPRHDEIPGAELREIR